MKNEKRKDFRINNIHLLSNGWVGVWDKNEILIKELCGAYSISLHDKLKNIAPETISWHGFSKGHIEFAVDNMNKYGKPK